MKITVKVKTRSREEKVERISQPSLGLDDVESSRVAYRVSVKEAPLDGKANEAVIRVLAEYFDIPRSCVHLILGHTFSQKVFEIDGGV